jgi:hypothetical protein
MRGVRVQVGFEINATMYVFFDRTFFDRLATTA